MKRDLKRSLIAAIATVAILSIAFTCFGYYKDVKAEEMLAERSAIPETEITTMTKMIENLRAEQYVDPQIDVLVCKSTDESRTYVNGKIDYDKNIRQQIALIALNPLNGPLADEDIYSIKSVEVSWMMGQIKITLKGGVDGWESIRWVSENYDLLSPLEHPSVFTIEQAENFKFKAPTTVVLPSETI